VKRRPRPGKIALKLFVLLLAGAIINVVVAWGCAARADFIVGRIEYGSFERANEIAVRGLMSQCGARRAVINSWPKESAPERVRALPSLDQLPNWIESVLDESRFALKPDAFGRPRFALADAFGLPWLSLGCSWQDEYVLLTGVRLDDTGAFYNSETVRAFPLRPLWPGFAINTIFYAAVLWVLFAVPGAIRKRVRRKRGQCAACGYSLRGTPEIDKCPECGATA
jgi:hypothetical protein